MTDQTTPTPPETPLESWKAIAAYLSRDARTVMRWEKSEGLPVHRHRHLARSTVYAFPSELDSWRANRRVDPQAVQSVGGRFGSRLLAIAAALVLSLLSAGGGRFMGPLLAEQMQDRVVGWPDNARMAISSTMSRDGRLVTYVDADDRELHVRDVQSGATRTLTSIAAAGGAVSESAISNDGTRVAIASKDAGLPFVTGKLRILPLDGTERPAPAVIAEGQWFIPNDWSADDTRLVVTIEHSDTEYEIASVDIESRTVTRLVALGNPGPGEHVKFSPSGAVVYDVRASNASRDRDIMLLPAGGGEPVVLVGGPSSDRVIDWSADGSHVIFRSDRGGTTGIWAAPVAGTRAGDPVLLRADFQGDPRSLNAQGDLFYEGLPAGVSRPFTPLLVASIDPARGTVTESPWFAAHDRQADVRSPRWSKDGSLLMYITQRPEGPTIAIRSTETGVTKEIPFNLSYYWTFDWAPDGSRFVFRGINLEGREGVFFVDAATGAVETVVLKDGPRARAAGTGYYQPRFSADGQSLYYTRNGFSENLSEEIRRDLATGEETVLSSRPRVQGDDAPIRISQSPDGRLDLIGHASPTPTLSVQDLIDGTEREVFRVDRPDALSLNDAIHWLPDSRAIIARVSGEAPNERSLVWIPVDGRESHVIDFGRYDFTDTGFAIHPDGRQIAFVAGDPIVSKNMVPTTEFRVAQGLLGALGGGGRRNDLKDRN